MGRVIWLRESPNATTIPGYQKKKKKTSALATETEAYLWAAILRLRLNLITYKRDVYFGLQRLGDQTSLEIFRIF